MAEEHSSAGAGARRRSHRNLPEELQEEILRHLPVKSLIRFESVCKTWRSKFHSRRFIALYGRRRHPGGAVVYSILRKKLLEWVTGLRLSRMMMMINAVEPWTYWKRTTQVFGPSSNGIYCLTSYPRDKFSDRFCVFEGKIALCNPATHDYKMANPFPPGICSRLYRIASRPCQLHSGFGQIDSDSDYKVVVIVHYYGNYSYSSFLGFVYSLRSGKWKTIVDYKPGRRRKSAATEAFYRSRMTEIEDPVEVCSQGFFQGCWHWAARGEDNSYYVLSFDFADEAFKLIGAPLRNADVDVEELAHLWGSVFLLHDHLAFFYLFDPLLPPYHVDTDFDVWMMMEYGVEKSWTLIYKINPNFYGGFLKLVAIDYTPQQSGGGDEESGGVIQIKRLFFEDENHQLISCDDDGSQVCEASGRWSVKTHFFWNTPGISTYVESLERL